MDRNENTTEHEDMTVAPVSQKEHKHMKTVGNISDSSIGIDIKTTENMNKKSDGIVENQRRRKEKYDKVMECKKDSKAVNVINDAKSKKGKNKMILVKKKRNQPRRKKQMIWI